MNADLFSHQVRRHLLPAPDPSIVGLKVYGLFALIGAGIGAAAGHEDRYLVEPR